MKDNKIIIGLVGEFAAGKGAAAEYLAKKYKAKVYKFSDPLNDILNRIGEKIIRDNQCAVANSLRKDFGEDILSKVLMIDATKIKNRIIVVDGFRKMGELNFFRKKYNFILINVKADIKIRYQRIANRGEKADEKNKSLKSFIKDHKLPADIEITRVGKKADFTIDNSGTKKELYLQIDKIIKKINEKK
jgi:dephospho-CoA kinase